jgi:hypothetical protein
VLFILEPNDVTRGLVRKRVTISDYPDGRLVITHNGLPLPYRIFDKVRQVNQGAIVDNKRLSAALAVIKQQQEQAPQRRSQKAPTRRDQPNHLFALPAQPAPSIPTADIAPETLPGLREMHLPEPAAAPAHSDTVLLADDALPAMIGDFRLFNRYVVMKREKKSGRIGARRKKQLEPITPELIDALPAGEGRLSSALALDRFYREAA